MAEADFSAAPKQNSTSSPSDAGEGPSDSAIQAASGFSSARLTRPQFKDQVTKSFEKAVEDHLPDGKRFKLPASYDPAMSTVLPPNPSLIAILLVIKTRNGPRFVFHYPELPSEEPARLARWPGAYGATAVIEEHLTDESDYSGSSDDDFNEYGPSADTGPAFERNRQRKFPRGPDDDEGDSSEPSSHTQEKGAAWEKVLGYSTDGLESLLTPGRSFNKRKFEITLGDIVYVSHPVHIREEGTWMKKRERRKKSTVKSESDDFVNLSKSEVTPKVEVDKIKELNGGVQSNLARLDLGDTTSASEDDDEVKSTSTDNENAMTMFNVVFVLNPPRLEYHLRVKEMYDYVIKKFTKALKYEQARSNYVWRETDLILGMREKAKESKIPMSVLWPNILAQSTLAKAISEVFHSISTSKIAHVFFNDNFDISLQIPQIGEISILPSLLDPQLPGLWLTTANSYDQDENDSDNMLAKHFALLLLDSPSTILKEVEDEAKQLSAPLAHYIRCSKPTLSFLQVSQASGLSLQDINILARHLIYWRRARAIPPLHQRDIYIVSPNADLSALPSATVDYARTFPSLPSLRKMLGTLSGLPRPYSSIIPSRDHRGAYLEILAWLVRGGWVTQLRSFAWIQVTASIKAAVAAEDSALPSSPPPPSTITPFHPSDHDAGPEDLPSNYLSPPPRPVSAAGSTSSASTIRRRPSSTLLLPSGTSTNPLPSQGPSNSQSQASPKKHTTSLILDPHRANALESRWIAAIGESFTYAPARELWPRVVRYFNGRHALEKIWVREGLGAGREGGGGNGTASGGGECWRRKEVWRAMGEMEEEGGIVVGRHW